MRNLITQDGLTQKQIAVLELLVDPLDKRTEAEKARVVGINRCTLTRWKKQPGFLSKIGDMSMSYLKQRLPEINYALVVKAKDGDVPAIRLVYDVLGLTSHKVQVQGEIKVANFNISEELMYDVAESIIRTKNRDNAGTGEERPVLPM